MRNLKKNMMLCFLGMLGATLAPRARAAEWNEKTFVTFNNPVEVPGVVLPPGTYVFRLLGSPSDRNIVQIFNRHETRIYATLLAIPDYRLQPTGKTVITFEERAAGSPEAIKAWFYPGDDYGQEFVYPKVRAVELAKVNRQPVPSMPSEMSRNITQPAKTSSAPAVAALKNAPIKAVTPQQKEVEIAQALPPKPPAQQEQKRLPRTASDFPLVGLAGVLALGMGASVRLLSKKLA